MLKKIITRLLPVVLMLSLLIPAFSFAEGSNSLTIQKYKGVKQGQQIKPDDKGVAGSRYAIWKLSGDDLKPEKLDTESSKKLSDKLNDMSIEELFKAYGDPKLSEPTDADGKTTVSNLEDGRYYVAEVEVDLSLNISAEEGITRSAVIKSRTSGPIPFVIDLPFVGVDGKIQKDVKVYPKEEEEKPGKTTLVKYKDDNDGKGEVPFGGAKFTLYKKSEIDNVDDEAVKFDKNGNYVTEGGTSDFVTDNEGKIVFKGLPHGKYYFAEKDKPKEYELRDKNKFVVDRLEFVIDNNNTNVEITAINKLKTGGVKEETPERGGEKFLKVDDSSDEKRLEGAVFKLMVEDKEKSKPGSLILKDYEDSSGNKVTVKSNEKGEFEFNNLPLGTYYVQETSAPAGYSPLTQAIKVEITADSYSDGKKIVVKNKKAPEPSRTPGVESDTPSKGAGGSSSGGGGVAGTTPSTTKPGVTIPTTGDIQIFLYAAAGIAVVLLGLYMYRSESKKLSANIG